MTVRNPARLAALAVVVLLTGCTTPPANGPSQGADATQPSVSTPGSTPATASPDASASGSASAATPGGSGSVAPAAIVLSGTAIGGRALDRASVKDIDAVVGAKLGKAKVGRPQLCRAEGQNSALAVVDHSWSGLTVSFGSSGGAAVAIGWSVDATDVPDGVELGGNLPWRPPFSTLQRMGADLSTSSGTRYAQLTREQVTYSGPVGAKLPDAVSGGPVLSCG